MNTIFFPAVAGTKMYSMIRINATMAAINPITSNACTASNHAENRQKYILRNELIRKYASYPVLPAIRPSTKAGQSKSPLTDSSIAVCRKSATTDNPKILSQRSSISQPQEYGLSNGGWTVPTSEHSRGLTFYVSVYVM